MSATATEMDQLESRVAELELKLGTSLSNQTKLEGGQDLRSVLDKFIRQEIERLPPVPPGARASDATDASKRLALHEDFRAIDRLLKELDLVPLAGPTAAGGASAPLFFRRMEILASSESMKRDMELLATIRDLTSIGRKASESNEAKVADCPIVSTDRYNIIGDKDAVQRLDKICFRAANLNKRAAIISQRVDQLLNSYSEVMGALSEKMVLAKEQIEVAD